MEPRGAAGGQGEGDHVAGEDEIDVELMAADGWLESCSTRSGPVGWTARSVLIAVRNTKGNRVPRRWIEDTAERRYCEEEGLGQRVWRLDVDNLSETAQAYKREELMFWKDMDFTLGWETEPVKRKLLHNQPNWKPSLKHLALQSASGNFVDCAGTNPKTGEDVRNAHMVFLLDGAEVGLATAVVSPINTKSYRKFQENFRMACAAEREREKQMRVKKRKEREREEKKKRKEEEERRRAREKNKKEHKEDRQRERRSDRKEKKWEGKEERKRMKREEEKRRKEEARDGDDVKGSRSGSPKKRNDFDRSHRGLK